MTAPLTRFLHIARRVLTGAPIAEPVFLRIDFQFKRAERIVQLYYLMSVYIVYATMAPLHQAARDAVAWDLLWPVAWMDRFDTIQAVDWLTFLCFVAALAAFQFPHVRPFRFLFAALYLCIAAASNSLGGINHGFHAWFWIGVILVLLPHVGDRNPARAVKMAYLAVFSSAQALILSFYTMAGLWKITFGIHGLMFGYEGNFAPRGFALQLANRIVQTGTSPLLADFAIDLYWVSWPMFLFVIYLQFTAIIVLFRPRLHPVWGYFLIAFHLGTWLLMEISFPQHILFLLLLFVLSPYRPKCWTVGEALDDLPVIGPAFRFARPGPHTRRSPQT